MNRYRFLLFFVLGIVLFGACEKDDICVDGDTPLLILTFYDAQNPETPKSVSSLRIVGLGEDGPIDTFSDRSSTDSVGIPLRINQSESQFVLIVDSADEEDTETGNIDTLSFQYITSEVFISRACGFVANFESVNPILTADTENWIQNIEVVNPSVIKLDSAHVKIFH